MTLRKQTNFMQLNMEKSRVRDYPWRLWVSYCFAVFGSASEIGWNQSILNLPEDYIVCWIEGVQTNNETLINKTDPLCNDARSFSDQLSNQALNFYALTNSINMVGALADFRKLKTCNT